MTHAPNVFDAIAIICHWLMWLSVGGLAGIAAVALRMLKDENVDPSTEG